MFDRTQQRNAHASTCLIAKRAFSACLCLGLLFIVWPAASAAAWQSPERQWTIAQLIEQLGDSEFLVRQRATEQLRSVGSPAIEALTEAANGTSTEVAFRSRVLLRELLDKNEEARTQRFLALSPTDKDDCGFEDWEEFSTYTGNSKAARTLFIAALDGSLSLTGNDANRRTSPPTIPAGYLNAYSMPDLAAEMFAQLHQWKSKPMASRGQHELPSDEPLAAFLTDSRKGVQLLQRLRDASPDEAGYGMEFRALLAAWMRQYLTRHHLSNYSISVIAKHQLDDFCDDLFAAINQSHSLIRMQCIMALATRFQRLSQTGPLPGSDGGGDEAQSDRSRTAYALRDRLVSLFQNVDVLVKMPAEDGSAVDVTVADFAFQRLVIAKGDSPKKHNMQPGLLGVQPPNGNTSEEASTVWFFPDPETSNRAKLSLIQSFLP